MEKEMTEIDILKLNVRELQGQLQLANRRIGELNEIIDIERQKNEKSVLIADGDVQFITE